MKKMLRVVSVLGTPYTIFEGTTIDFPDLSDCFCRDCFSDEICITGFHAGGSHVLSLMDIYYME